MTCHGYGQKYAHFLGRRGAFPIQANGVKPFRQYDRGQYEVWTSSLLKMGASFKPKGAVAICETSSVRIGRTIVVPLG